MELTEMIDATREDLGRMQENINLAIAIDAFKEKMTIKIASYIGEREGWDDEENAVEMHSSLELALRAGDYVSVANYAMFLDGLGYNPRGKQS